MWFLIISTRSYKNISRNLGHAANLEIIRLHFLTFVQGSRSNSTGLLGWAPGVVGIQKKEATLQKNSQLSQAK